MIHELKNLISQGETELTIKTLLEFVDKYYTRFASEVILISNRYSQISKELRLGTIPRSDYSLEINSINFGLLQIIDSIEGLEEKNFKKKKSKEEIIQTIEVLESRFDKSRKRASNIKTNASRLREKNDIARELGEIFINHPELIKDYFHTESDGIITGIANRYKRVPESDCIDFFESVLPNVSGNFTKCCIINAMAELIYTGQFLGGDEKRIEYILITLFPDSSPTARQNINRVYTELEYFFS